MISPMEIYQLLPKTNCKRCGEATCMAFALKLLTREHRIDDCDPLLEPKYSSNLAKLREAVGEDKSSKETGLVIHEDLCSGCGNCVVACPVNVANDPKGAAEGRGPTSERVILKVNGSSVILQSEKECRRIGPNRILCNACIVSCPYKAIEFVG